MKNNLTSSELSVLLQKFFCQRLLTERNVSLKTIAAYRDCFRLLLLYIQSQKQRQPTDLSIADLDESTVLSFLDYLEKGRGNCTRTRNARLAAIHTFFRYAAPYCPESLPSIQRVLAIPRKRFDRRSLEFLTRTEVNAIINAPASSTRSGRRDRVMWATFYNTGARVSEIVGIRLVDLVLDRSSKLALHGKGRKDRLVPLWKSTAARLSHWLTELDGGPQTPLFPNAMGRPLTRSGVEHRLRLAVRQASRDCPSLHGRRVSPHILRHTTAMHLLQAGVDLSVIAMWLGHESPATTHLYMKSDMRMKEQALEALQEPPGRGVRFRPGDRLLQFLEGL